MRVLLALCVAVLPSLLSTVAVAQTADSLIRAKQKRLSYTVEQGKELTKTIILMKDGPTQRSYIIGANSSWLVMKPGYGTRHTISTEEDKVAVTVKTAQLSIGLHSGVVYIDEQGPDGRLQLLKVPVLVTVTPPVAAVTAAPSCLRISASTATEATVLFEPHGGTRYEAEYYTGVVWKAFATPVTVAANLTNRVTVPLTPSTMTIIRMCVIEGTTRLCSQEGVHATR